MNPDFAIILNFKLKAGQNADADFLVKTARNIGARAISSNGAQAEFARAGQKYTIALVDEHVGSKLTDANVIDQIVQSRRDGKSAYIDVDLNDDGSLTAESSALLERINNWMHLFG
ncbi:hypothetical protein EQ500_09190, partial [Lactobacillus sp. XV13L]|nr:hypothetical protein [Lactobacillus sp. XV13L]